MIKAGLPNCSECGGFLDHQPGCIRAEELENLVDIAEDGLEMPNFYNTQEVNNDD